MDVIQNEVRAERMTFSGLPSGDNKRPVTTEVKSTRILSARHVVQSALCQTATNPFSTVWEAETCLICLKSAKSKPKVTCVFEILSLKLRLEENLPERKISPKGHSSFHAGGLYWPFDHARHHCPPPSPCGGSVASRTKLLKATFEQAFTHWYHPECTHHDNLILLQHARMAAEILTRYDKSCWHEGKTTSIKVNYL